MPISCPYTTTSAPVADDAAASGKPHARGSSPGRIADPSSPRTTAPEFLARLLSAAARRFAPPTRFLRLTNLDIPWGVQPRRIGLVSFDELNAARLADIVRVSMRRANHVEANRARRNRVRIVRWPLGVEPREIETFDHATEVLRSACVLVHQRAERAGRAWMMDERGCHTFR